MSRNRYPNVVDDFIADDDQFHGLFLAAERVATEAVLRDWLIRDHDDSIREGIAPYGCVISTNGVDKTIAITEGWGVQVNSSPTALYGSEYKLGGYPAGTLTIPNNTTGNTRYDLVQGQVQIGTNTSAGVKHRSPTSPYAQGTQSVDTIAEHALVFGIKEGTTNPSPTPDSGWFAHSIITVPDGFTYSNECTPARDADLDLLVTGRYLEIFEGDEVGYIHVHASRFTESADWDYGQNEAGDGVTTPGSWTQGTVGTSKTLVIPIPTEGLDNVTLVDVKVGYDADTVPGTVSERAWINTIRYYPLNGLAPSHAALSSSGKVTVDATGDQWVSQTFDQNQFVNNQLYSFFVLVRGVETGTPTTGDRCYHARISYTRPKGNVKP